jgi:hypothetical protein
MRGSFDVVVSGEATTGNGTPNGRTARDLPLRVTIDDGLSTRPRLTPTAAALQPRDQDAGVVRTFRATGPVQVLTNDADVDGATIDLSSVAADPNAVGPECGDLTQAGIGGQRETVHVESALRVRMLPVAGDSTAGRRMGPASSEFANISNHEDDVWVVHCPLQNNAMQVTVNGGPWIDHRTSGRGLAYRVEAVYERTEQVTAVAGITPAIGQAASLIRTLIEPVCALPALCPIVTPVLNLLACLAPAKCTSPLPPNVLPPVTLPATTLKLPLPGLTSIRLPALRAPSPPPARAIEVATPSGSH